MTNAERKLWWHLRESAFEGVHFRRQATIGSYFVDFCCHAQRVVVEVDGGGHAERNRMIADRRRTAYLESRGYRVLRFWNNEVLKNIEGVMSVIYDTLKDDIHIINPPPLTPPRHSLRSRGEGNISEPRNA